MATVTQRPVDDQAVDRGDIVRLEAQAVIARSYALRARNAGAPYDVFADTRSQVYGGVGSEVAAASAAVAATRGEIVTYAGLLAQTYFSSSSGGRTAANEEIWGGAPVPYLRSVDDPYDRLSPYHRWSARFGDREASRRLADVADVVVPRQRPSLG